MKVTQISINVNSEANHCPISLDSCYSCPVSNEKLLLQETSSPVIFSQPCNASSSEDIARCHGRVDQNSFEREHGNSRSE